MIPCAKCRDAAKKYTEGGEDYDLCRKCVAKAIQAARAGDEVEVDGDAKVSASDLGCYVQSWVWVEYEEGGQDGRDHGN